MPFNGDSLRTIRLYRNLNQRELAELVAVSPASISFYETGKRDPDEEVVTALCDVLGVLPEFFEMEAGRLDGGNFRSQRAASKRLENRVLSHASLVSVWVRHIRSVVRLPVLDVPEMRVGGPGDIEDAADACREHWGLEFGPIRHVNRVLENAGVVVARITDEATEIDAFSSFDGDPPIVALSTAKGSASRAVFDTVHELGHGVMHRGVGTRDQDRETEANHFAGAFLLPRSTFPREFWSAGGTSLGHLVELKLRWGVSITAMIYRARQLGLIDTAQYRRWMKNISRRGWRSGVQEPSEPEPPMPELLPTASARYLEIKGITAKDAAAALGWSDPLFTEITGIAALDIEPGQEPILHSLEEYRARRESAG